MSYQQNQYPKLLFVVYLGDNPQPPLQLLVICIRNLLYCDRLHVIGTCSLAEWKLLTFRSKSKFIHSGNDKIQAVCFQIRFGKSLDLSLPL